MTRLADLILECHRLRGFRTSSGILLLLLSFLDLGLSGFDFLLLVRVGRW